MFIGLSPEISNFLGYFFGFFSSYFFNKKYNFKSTNSHQKDLPKFLLSMCMAFLVNLLVLSISYRLLMLNAYLSQVIAGIFYIITGYLLSKLWVFRTNIFG